MTAPKEDAPLRRSEPSRERFGAVASGLVALLALFISAYTVYVQREQLKAQVWPRLALVDHSTGSWPDVHYAMGLKNRGTAPADIRSLRLVVGSDEAGNWVDWGRLLEKHQPTVRGDWSIPSAHSPVDDVLGPGDEETLIETSSPTLLALMSADRETTMTICYCSMLGDCWEYVEDSADDKQTRPVSGCPAPKKKFLTWPEGVTEKNVKELLRLAAAKGAGEEGAADASVDAK